MFGFEHELPQYDGMIFHNSQTRVVVVYMCNSYEICVEEGYDIFGAHGQI